MKFRYFQLYVINEGFAFRESSSLILILSFFSSQVFSSFVQYASDGQ